MATRMLRVAKADNNISPKDDRRLYGAILKDGLFEDCAISWLGDNLVQVGAMFGIMQGSEFTTDEQKINVALPESGTANGYIYVQFDLDVEDNPTIGSALGSPSNVIYEDINKNGKVCQMAIATYSATAIAVSDVTKIYEISRTRGVTDQLDFFWPVGSIYSTDNKDFNPNVTWGGRWEKIADRFIVGAGNKYAAGSTGGYENATLPAHSHTVSGSTDWQGNHNHSLQTWWSGNAGASEKIAGASANGAGNSTGYTRDAGNHQHSVSGSTNQVGGDGTGKNIPPYFGAYIWHRTA